MTLKNGVAADGRCWSIHLSSFVGFRSLAGVMLPLVGRYGGVATVVAEGRKRAIKTSKQTGTKKMCNNLHRDASVQATW